MAEESYGFENARVRLDDIVSQVRKKEVSLEKSLDLLEEGVRLANQCVEQIDQADWDSAAGVEQAEDGDAAPEPSDAAEPGDSDEDLDSAESAEESAEEPDD